MSTFSEIYFPFQQKTAVRRLLFYEYFITSEYKQSIEKDKALERRFQKILVEEPNKKELRNILINIKPIYESYHGVIISEDIIDSIIDLSSKYIYDRYEPDRSIDILDEVCARTSLKENI